MLKEIKNNLKELGLNNNEIKVYLSLTQLGEATAAQIAKKADMPRTTAISILDKLKNNNFITTHKYKGTTYYWVESPKTIKGSLLYKVEIAENLENTLNDLYRSESHFPFAQVYDTKTNIKKFIEKLLINAENKTIFYTIDTPKAGNYAKIYPEGFEKIILKQKKKKSIITHSLIPYGSFQEISSYKIKDQNINIREMPAEINFKASLWIIKDMVIHFSGNPPFIVMIKHDMINQGIKSVFDFLWNISTPKS